MTRLGGALTAAWVCGLLLAACAPQPPAPEAAPVPASAPAPAASAPAVKAEAAEPAPAPETSADGVAREMLELHSRARQMSTPDLVREIVRLTEGPPSPRATLQAALLLGQTRNNGDIARALVMLDALLRSTAPEAAPWQPLARLLADRYADQRRLEEQVERQNQQARESQRRLDQMNEKLEALKAIERSLTTRPPAGAPAPAAAPPPKAP